MEEKTTEMISYIIKNKKYPMLVCPQCKSSIIQITSLKREIITFKCPCSPCNISLPPKEFIALFDHDDILHPSVLYEYVKVINEKNAF